MRRLVAAVVVAVSAATMLGSCILPGAGGLTVHAIFSDVGDLPRFANVQTSDVVIGTVRRIELEGYHARVTMSIEEEARVPANAIALIRSTSLLGEKFVDLRPPEGEAPSPLALGDGAVIPVERTERLPGIDDALVKLGRLLEGGTSADLAAVLHSSAAIVRGREEALGEVFANLRPFSGVFADRAPDIAAAISSLDAAFETLAGGTETITRALGSSADATGVLVEQQENLSRLVSSLDDASAVLARYMRDTRAASDAALKDLRLVLDEVMKTTGDLEKALVALAQFSDLWPRAIPGDYIQLDIVLHLANESPSQFAAGGVEASGSSLQSVLRRRTVGDLIWGAVR